VSQLPSRAFDSPAQRAETPALAADLQTPKATDLTPDIDARFAKLAQERIAAIPCAITYGCRWGAPSIWPYAPRVENLNIDLDWWVYEHHQSETISAGPTPC